jgi:hypothetical protein
MVEPSRAKRRIKYSLLMITSTYVTSHISCGEISCTVKCLTIEMLFSNLLPHCEAYLYDKMIKMITMITMIKNDKNDKNDESFVLILIFINLKRSPISVSRRYLTGETH